MNPRILHGSAFVAPAEFNVRADTFARTPRTFKLAATLSDWIDIDPFVERCPNSAKKMLIIKDSEC